MEAIPGILEKEWVEIERKINLVKPFAKTIHIDIIDGKFAANSTFLDPSPFAKYTKDIFFEAHLMVEEPIQYLEPFGSVGFRRFLGHIEKMPDQAEFIAQAQLLGEVGLAIDAPTPIEALEVPLDDLDCLLIMAVKAGESGQAFVPKYLKKVGMLRHSMKQVQDMVWHDMKIEVDGGISDTTIVEAKNAGATRFVADSFIFKSHDPQLQFNLLRNKVG